MANKLTHISHTGLLLMVKGSADNSRLGAKHGGRYTEIIGFIISSSVTLAHTCLNES